MNSNIKNIVPFWLGRKLRGWLQKAKAIYYKGGLFYCPYCNHSFRAFLPGGSNIPVLFDKQVIGAGYRQNDVCPRCYSLDRDRLVYLFLHDKTNVFTAPLKIFHVAPEGCIRALLNGLPNLTYIAGVKYLEGYYYERQTNLLDITNIPYNDEAFDVIICNHVLEHIEDDKLAMRELYRVLKPGGMAILQVPISNVLTTTYEDPAIVKPEDREKAFGQFDHVRIYGQDYQTRLENTGFTVRPYSPYENKTQEELKKFAVNPAEKLFVAYK